MPGPQWPGFFHFKGTQMTPKKIENPKRDLSVGDELVAKRDMCLHGGIRLKAGTPCKIVDSKKFTFSVALSGSAKSFQVRKETVETMFSVIYSSNAPERLTYCICPIIDLMNNGCRCGHLDLIRSGEKIR